MEKIKVENFSNNERVEIPVKRYLEEESYDECFTKANKEENKYKIIAIIILVIVFIIGFFSLFSKLTIEDYRKQNLKEAKILYNSYGIQYNNAIKKAKTLSGKIRSTKECIRFNSYTGTATECNLNFNK